MPHTGCGFRLYPLGACKWGARVVPHTGLRVQAYAPSNGYRALAGSKFASLTGLGGREKIFCLAATTSAHAQVIKTAL